MSLNVNTGPAVRTQRLRAIVASTVGTTIEWYDFFLYGTAAALVFPKVFFPGDSPYAGILLSFGTQCVGFIARPIGAMIFGHYGDRIGRKATLIVTLLLMGLATFAVAFVPTYATIGRHPDRAALHSRRGRRRRMGRLRIDVDGVGAYEFAPRIRRFVAAIRRARGILHCQSCRAGN